MVATIAPIEEEKQVFVESKVEVDRVEEATNNIRQHYQEKLDIANDDLAKYKGEVSTLKLSISEIGNQRDFYYSKLRDIEILTCKNSNLEKDALANLIKTILFSQKECELIYDEEGNVLVKNH